MRNISSHHRLSRRAPTVGHARAVEPRPVVAGVVGITFVEGDQAL